MMMVGPVYLTASPCQSFGLIFNEIEYDGQRWLEIIAEIDHTCCSFMKVAVGDVAVTFNGKSVRTADELTGINLTKERAIDTHKQQNDEIPFPPAGRRNVAEIDWISDERRFESTEERIVQVRKFKLTTPTFVERALYGYQYWLKLVPSCRHFSSIIIGLIICIRHVA